mgnify:CR=1 FL=1
MQTKCIGKRIKGKRLENGWSQEDLAEKTNLSPVYIGMIERGEKVPKLETFIRIANALNSSADELLLDVLDYGYIIKISKYTEKIKTLDKKNQNKLFKIIEIYLE